MLYWSATLHEGLALVLFILGTLVFLSRPWLPDRVAHQALLRDTGIFPPDFFTALVLLTAIPTLIFLTAVIGLTNEAIVGTGASTCCGTLLGTDFIDWGRTILELVLLSIGLSLLPLVNFVGDGFPFILIIAAYWLLIAYCVVRYFLGGNRRFLINSMVLLSPLQWCPAVITALTHLHR